MAIKLKIISTQPDNVAQECAYEQSLITFGRSKSCTVALDHDQVSRRHFIIRFTEGSYVIVDEGSKAGTVLDNILLDPKNCYTLGSSHEIILPGYKIILENDGQAPRQERTTVMARKLMGKILNDANDDEQIPRLTELSGQNIFYFHNDKSSFVLGSLARLDFVVSCDNLVAKEHVSFMRDISGVRVIPILEAQTWINDREIHGPEILNHGDILTIGATKFIYQDYQDDQPIKPEALIPPPPAPENHEEPLIPAIAPANNTVRDSRWLISFDRIFWGLFAMTAAGASYIMIKILQ